MSKQKTKKDVREFSTGATRDLDSGKLDFEGFLSPLVLERFGQYMNQHRKQSNGEMRDSDNWQKHFGDKHYDVCMKSLWRHFHCAWSAHRGLPTKETLEESLMAVLFNTMAYADKLLKDKLNDNGKK